MLKIYVYSYLELIWLARRLAPDFKTIAEFFRLKR
jgi:hypothetical protein